MRHNIVCMAVGLTVMAGSLAAGIPDYPVDVEEFIDRRELCDHFRGEEPYDADRARFLAEQIRKACTGTDAELKALKQKYKDDREILAVLDRFEERIESTGGR